MHGEWRKLEEREIQVPSPKGRAIALLDGGGEIVAAGELLMKGPDSYWLFKPLSGYVQWAQGFPADGGVVPECFSDFMPYAPRADRLKVVDLLLSRQHAAESLGDFKRFAKCDRCQGYKVQRVFVTSKDEFLAGGCYVSLETAKGLSAFLHPEQGICMCY